MITGGKSKYTNLLTLIKHESPKLYEVVGDLCLDGMFRSVRYENTFLMPGSKLIEHIIKLVDNDEDFKAIDVIRSLMLKDHHKIADFKKGAKIGTLQFAPSILADPEAVASQISDFDKEIIVNRKGDYATVIYKYRADEPPATVEGKTGGLQLVGKSGGAPSPDSDLEAFNNLTKKLIVENDSETTVDNFFKAVSGVLIMLQDQDEARFNRAKYYLASNPILSWYFLTKAGHPDALVPVSMLKDFQWQSVSDFSIIKKAEEVKYSFNKDQLRKVRQQRTTLLNEKGDRSGLVKELSGAYRHLMKDALAVGAVDEYLSKHVELKMLMDELRFRYDDSINEWSEVDDLLDTLKLANWSSPQKSFVVLSQEVYESGLVKGVEAFVSGPVNFVKSFYFMYAPLTEEVCDQLEKVSKSGGAITGGNPAMINSVIFTGGAARKARSKKAADVKLSALVKVLSKDQREALKKLL